MFWVFALVQVQAVGGGVAMHLDVVISLIYMVIFLLSLTFSGYLFLMSNMMQKAFFVRTCCQPSDVSVRLAAHSEMSLSEESLAFEMLALSRIELHPPAVASLILELRSDGLGDHAISTRVGVPFWSVRRLAKEPLGDFVNGWG